MDVQKFKEYQQINEEFIGGIIKGALGKLAGVFSAPFKDLVNDFKKMFKEDDPDSIKDVLMSNINQAIDAAQKEVNNLQDETSVIGVMDNMINTLVQLAENIGKDVESAFGKDKSAAIKEIAKALLLGNKAADWVGLVGVLDPQRGILKKDINYKFSKKNYIDQVNKAKDLKAKKAVANKFFDDLQKSLQIDVDKNFTEEEVKKAFDEAKKKSGQKDDSMNYDKLKELFDKKTPVIYLLKDKKKSDYDPKKKPEDQANIVGVKTIDSLNDQDRPDSVVLLDKDGKPTIKKSYTEIIGPAEEPGENATKAKEVLGKIKQDEGKMGQVVKFAEFIQDDKNKDKVAEIQKILNQ